MAPVGTGGGLTSGSVPSRNAKPPPPSRRRRGSTASVALVLGAVVVAGAALTACGTSPAASSATKPVSSVTTRPQSVTATTGPLTGEVAVAFPVVACTTSSGATLAGQGWKPSILLAPIPTALVGKVEFYSDGVHTVLGPNGWACSEAPQSDGGSGLVVYPPGSPDPPVGSSPAPGTQGIFAIFDTTDNVRGITLVCPYFTLPTWQMQEAACTGTKPAGEQSSMSTPDVVSVTDPAGVVGSLEGSGGPGPVTGAVIFPQVEPAVTDGSAVDVAQESCSLPDPTLCTTVLADFEVREFPVPDSTTEVGGDDSRGQSSADGRSGGAAAPTTTHPVTATPATVATAPAVTQPTPTSSTVTTPPAATG